MKPPPSLLLRTPKPPVQIRGKSKNSGEEKVTISSSSSSDFSSAEAKHNKNNHKIVVRSLSSDFDAAPEDPSEDPPDPDLSFDSHVLAFDSPPAISSELTAEEKDEDGEVATVMVRISVWRMKGLDLCSDPVILARVQIGLTLLLTSLVALLNVVAVASRSDQAGGEWGFSDPPPT